MGRKLAALAACRACALAVVTGRDWKQLERNSSVCERPCEARVGELALRPGLDWMGFNGPAWFHKADERGCAAEHLASPRSQRTPPVLTMLCRSAAPVGQTSGSRCFSYIPSQKA